MTKGAPEGSSWEERHWGRRIAIALLAGIWALGLRAWNASWRVDFSEAHRLDEVRAQPRPVIAVFWHGNYIPLFTTLAGRSVLVATSRSFRGAVIAGIARNFGCRTIQVGNHPHSTGEALLRELARPHGFVAVAVDGPLGPRHIAKPGVVVYAARTGARIVPVMALSTREAVLARRWDKMELPLPLSRVTLRIGDPIEISPTEAENVAVAAERVSRALNGLEAAAPD